MKIFIIGWGRTGTTTVTSALRILGFNILGWNDWWFNEELSANMLDDLLHGNSFRCLSDYDGADQCVIPIYKQIDNDLPGSKFILTIRDLDEWSVSYLAHYRRITDKYPPKIDFKSYWRVAKTGSIVLCWPC